MSKVVGLSNQRSYNRLLLFVAGLGGLLYGIDVGIIGGALPYLEATSKLTGSQLSIVVAAVLLGSVFSTLFAGLLADWMGRKPLMVLSGTIFVLSIPAIALSQSYGALFIGRLLQGMSGGFVGVVVPLYLAECLPARDRGKGTGIFQWLLTLGIVSAAVIGTYYSYRVAEIARVATPDVLFHVKDQAWRRIFWMSMPPGILFVLGSLFVAESPRWLFKRGKKDLTFAALLRSRSEEQAQTELQEMEVIARSAQGTSPDDRSSKGSLLRRRYVIPFLLACVILFCNTATGVNSIIGYNTDILLQSGLSDVRAHWGYVVFTCLNFLMTVIGMALVDRKGRKFLFLLGTSGIIVSLIFIGTLFLKTEARRHDVGTTIQSMATDGQGLTLRFDEAEAQRLLAANGFQSDGKLSLSVIYSYGGFTATTSTVRSDDAGAAPLQVSRAGCVPSSKVEAFFRNPFVNLDTARTAPLRIEHAYIAPVPSEAHGWLVALGMYSFIAFYAMGPGVCVWLALSELMPTRIRSNGMSIALVINQLVSTTLAAIFLPVVGKYGYSTMFFLFTGFTIVYLLTIAIFLPETKGKTLEEIEEHFEAA
ncbi:MFS transporter [Granulicella sp. dw_53]|uniref:MFS transporter n=1 Tax=Granulicella sp. dw_53 TaxID=2719792 RepID=UPI001BD27B74|nr:MFS transporter [Granulicella sp. dw_53]